MIGSELLNIIHSNNSGIDVISYLCFVLYSCIKVFSLAYYMSSPRMIGSEWIMTLINLRLVTSDDIIHDVYTSVTKLLQFTRLFIIRFTSEMSNE